MGMNVLPSIYNFIACVGTPFVFSDAQVNNSSTSYAKLKEIKINGAGRIRIKFDLESSNGSYTAYGQIWINGSAVGTERSTNSVTYITYTEDLTVNDGDLVQIYGKVQSGTSVYIQNFRIYGLPTSVVNI